MAYFPKEKIVRAVQRFAFAAVVCLFFNMVAMVVWWGGVSDSTGVRGFIQLTILVGFVFILLFDILSVGWVLTRVCWIRDQQSEEGCQKGWVLVLATLAIVGMMGAKVMVDEITRETPMGGAGGEWVVLYICLGLQLAYLGALLFQRPGPVRAGGEGP